MAHRYRIALATIALAAAAPASAAVPAAQYDVQLLVREGEGPPTSPRLLVRAGRPATFVVANARYSLRVTATPDAGNKVAVASHVTTWLPDGLHNDTSTVSIEADGGLNTILAPHIDPATGAVRGMRIEVSVRPAGD